MNRHCQALESATAFLNEYFERLRLEGGVRVEPILVLAGKAGVGLSTMARAVAEMRDRGIIATCRGRGIELVKEGAVPAGETTGTQTKPVWERVAAAMRNDIANGLYRPGEVLPPYKVLCGRYQATYRSLRKSLVYLNRTKLLEPVNRHFRVPSLRLSQARNTVILIAGGSLSGGLQMYSLRTQENFRLLENVCLQSNLKLRIMPYDTHRSMLFAERENEKTETIKEMAEQALGVIVCTTAMQQIGFDQLMNQLIAYGKNISVFHEGKVLVCPKVARGGYRIAQFSSACTPSAGRDVGRYLISQGHKKVAYVSPLGDYGWSQDRFSGLLQAYEAISRSKAVIPFECDQAKSYQMDAPVYNDDGTVAYEKTELFARTFRRMKSVESQYYHLVQREICRVSMRALMAQAICEPGITAWVAANDNFALDCLDFLKEQKNALPGYISVVGFDDNPEGFFQKLSSYNFNGYAAMHSLLNHLLNPSGTDNGALGGLVKEIEGYVVGRDSSGVARDVG